jgi:hypothetical protein
VDAAALNGSIRAINEALVMHPSSRQQQAGKLLNTLVASYAGLTSEAPGQLKEAFAKVGSFYRAVEAKLASGRGQFTLSDIEPAARPGVAAAAHQISSYFATHCASSSGG